MTKSDPGNCSNGGKWPPPLHDECIRNIAWDIARPVYRANAQVHSGIYRTRADFNYTGRWQTCQ